LCCSFFVGSSDAQFAFTATPVDDLTITFDPPLTVPAWLGADIASSIYLFDEIYLWFFGDTLIGKLTDVNGQIYRVWNEFTHGTVAIVNFALSLEPVFLSQSENGKIAEAGLLVPQNPTIPGEYYWMIDGLIGPKSGLLFVLCAVVGTGDNGTQGGNFASDIAIVQNPTDLPTNWVYTTIRNPWSAPLLQWNSAIVYNPADGYIYMTGLDWAAPQAPKVLSRILEADLIAANWGAMQFWSLGGTWQSNMDNLAGLMTGPRAMDSVVWHPWMNQWITFLLDPYDTYVSIAYAPELVGPWTVVPIYDIPAPYNNLTVFSNYGPMVHLEYCTQANEIVFTYTSNVASIANLGLVQDWSTYPELYHPLFVSVIVSKNN